MNCICHNRELVMELPSSAFPVGCCGCNGIVYGLEDEDCRQVRLPNILAMGISEADKDAYVNSVLFEEIL